MSPIGDPFPLYCPHCQEKDREIDRLKGELELLVGQLHEANAAARERLFPTNQRSARAMVALRSGRDLK